MALFTTKNQFSCLNTLYTNQQFTPLKKQLQVPKVVYKYAKNFSERFCINQLDTNGKNVIFGGCSYESVFINDDVFTWENFTVLWNAAFEFLASHPQVSLLDSVIVFSFSHHD